MRNFFTLLIATAILVFSACSSETCSSDNPIFTSNTPESEAYKAELARLLREKGPNSMTYRIGGYAVRSGQEYLQVNIQGHELCAIAEMSVSDWQKMPKVRENKGIGYRGARLAGLQFDIASDSAGTRFVFRDLDRIVD